MPIFAIQKRTIKIAIMKEMVRTRKKLNYRITVILKDEVIIEKFHTGAIAMDTIIELRKLNPDIFIGGALESKGEKWEVVWTLN